MTKEQVSKELTNMIYKKYHKPDERFDIGSTTIELFTVSLHIQTEHAIYNVWYDDIKSIRNHSGMGFEVVMSSTSLHFESNTIYIGYPEIKLYTITCHYNSASKIVARFYRTAPQFEYIRELKQPNGQRILYFEAYNTIANNAIFRVLGGEV